MKPLLHPLSILFLCLCLHDNLYSEGTKQILLNDAGHGKIEVMPSVNNFAWYTASGTSATAEYRLHINISNIGETIYYGFGNPLNSADIIVNDVTYRIKDPSGTIVVGPTSIPLSGTGHIATFTEAVAGPAAIVGATGYAALSYTPTQTGDYFIEFNFNTGFPGGHDRTKFKYFDITVATAANVAIDGRVWSKAWQMTADNQAPPSGVYTFWGKLYAYSDDGIVTSINFNGMEPFVFVVSCNPWGCYNTGNFSNDRRSVSGNHTLTQYKIFLNDPDPLVYPTGILGSVVPPIVITPNCNGSASIQIEVTKAGNLDILLDINPLPGIQPQDVSLTLTAVVGINTIPWNGLNGLGQQVANGTTFNVVVTYINGLTNLPISDVEENPDGFIIELKRPVGPAPPVFWDDILVGGTQNFTGCTFVLPTTGCHVFSGNNNTMNTWWYAVTSVSPAVVFIESRKPNPPGQITGPTVLCKGATGNIYWINKEINSTGYIWGYTGTGATITTINDTTVSVNFSNNATAGNITVSGTNIQCGAGTAQTLSVTFYPNPVVSLLPFSPVCINATPFTLTGGSPSGGTYWISGVQVTTFNPASQGTGSHAVTYIYTDPSTTCTSSATQNILVNPLPVVSFAPIAPVCLTASPVLLSGGNPSGGSYNGPGVNAGFFNPSVTGTGTFTIIYTYTNANGCVNSASSQITVLPLPTITFGSLSPVCITDTPFPLYGGNPGGGIYSGPGVTSGNFYPGVTGAGNFTITYTYTDANGCTNSKTAQITVNPQPTLTFTPPPPVCVTAMPFPLSGGAPPGGTYGGTAVLSGLFYPATAGVGSHLISYSYTDINGCKDTVYQTITVTPLPGTPGTIAGTVSVCQGASNVAYTVPPIADAVTYVWSVSPPSAGTITGSSTAGTMNYAANFTGNAIIFVKGVNNCGDGPSSLGFSVTINPNPVVTYTLCYDSITRTNAKPIQLKGGIPLGGTYSGVGVNSVTGIFNPAAAGIGTRTITYNYSNSYGCSGSTQKNIIVVAAAAHVCGNKLTDIRDNKQYNTVLIGTQCWMAENLNFGTTRTSGFTQRDNCVAEKYCYNDNSANCLTSGGLYQWDEIMQYAEIPAKQGLCPAGWHLPSETEWNVLFSNFINYGFAGSPLKSTGYSGFNAKLTGVDFFNKSWSFFNFATMFWSCNSDGPFKAWAHGLNFYNPSVSSYPSSRSNAFSVRCLKD
jgi:uncharacterized protein (TIGR02145 family)